MNVFRKFLEIRENDAAIVFIGLAVVGPTRSMLIEWKMDAPTITEGLLGALLLLMCISKDRDIGQVSGGISIFAGVIFKRLGMAGAWEPMVLEGFAYASLACGLFLYFSSYFIHPWASHFLRNLLGFDVYDVESIASRFHILVLDLKRVDRTAQWSVAYLASTFRKLAPRVVAIGFKRRKQGTFGAEWGKSDDDADFVVVGFSLTGQDYIVYSVCESNSDVEEAISRLIVDIAQLTRSPELTGDSLLEQIVQFEVSVAVKWKRLLRRSDIKEEIEIRVQSEWLIHCDKLKRMDKWMSSPFQLTFGNSRFFKE